MTNSVGTCAGSAGDGRSVDLTGLEATNDDPFNCVALLVRLAPRPSRLRELGSEIQTGQALGHLLIPDRPHNRLSARTEVVVRGLTREHALDVAQARSCPVMPRTRARSAPSG